MDRRLHIETFKGHELVVDAWVDQRNSWSWTYVIDGELTGASPSSSLLPNGETALRNAIAAAKARVAERG